MSSRNSSSRPRSGNRGRVAFVKFPIASGDNSANRKGTGEYDALEFIQQPQPPHQQPYQQKGSGEVGSVYVAGDKKFFYTSSFLSSPNFSLSSGALFTGTRRSTTGENGTPVLNTPLGDPGYTLEANDSRSAPLVITDADQNGNHGTSGGVQAEHREDYLEAERNAFLRVPPIPRLPQRLTQTFPRGAASATESNFSRCLSLDESEQANSPKGPITYGLTSSLRASAVNSPHSPKLASATQRLRASPHAAGNRQKKTSEAAELIIVNEQENSVSVSSCKENHTFPGLGGQNFSNVCPHPSSSFVSEQQLTTSINNSRSHQGGAGEVPSVSSSVEDNNNNNNNSGVKRRSSAAAHKVNQKYFSYITKKQIVTTGEFRRLGSFFFDGPLLDVTTHACAASFFVVAKAKRQFKLLGYLSSSDSRRNSLEFSNSLNAATEGRSPLAGSTSVESDSTNSSSTSSINLADGLSFLLYGNSLKDCVHEDHYRAYFPPFMLLGARLCYVDERGYVVGTFTPDDEAMLHSGLRQGVSLAFVFLLFASDMLDRLPQFPAELLCTTTPIGEIVPQPPKDVFTPEKLEANRTFDHKTPYKTQWMVVSLVRFAVMMQRWGKAPAEVTASYLAASSPHRPTPPSEGVTHNSRAVTTMPPKYVSTSPVSCASVPDHNGSLVSFSSFCSEQNRAANVHPYAKGGVPVRSNAAMDLRNLVNHQYDIHGRTGCSSSLHHTRDSTFSQPASSMPTLHQVEGLGVKSDIDEGRSLSPHPYAVQRKGMQATRPATAQPKSGRKFNRRLADIAHNHAEAQEKKPSDFFSLWRRQEAEGQWLRGSEGAPSPSSAATPEMSLSPSEHPPRSAVSSVVAVPVPMPPPSSQQSVKKDGRRHSSLVMPPSVVDTPNNSTTAASVHARSDTIVVHGSYDEDVHCDSMHIPVAEQESVPMTDTEDSYSVPATATAPPSSRSVSGAFREGTDRNPESGRTPCMEQTSLTSWSLNPGKAAAAGKSGPAPTTSSNLSGAVLGVDGHPVGDDSAGALAAPTEPLRPTRPSRVISSVTPALDSAELRATAAAAAGAAPTSSRFFYELSAPLVDDKAPLPEGALCSGAAAAAVDDEGAPTGFFSHISSPMKREMLQTPNNASLSGRHPLSSVGSELGSIVSSRKKEGHARLKNGVGAGVGLPHITSLTMHAVVIIQAVGRGFIHRKQMAAIPHQRRKKRGKQPPAPPPHQKQPQPQPEPQQKHRHAATQAASGGHASPPFRPSLQLSAPPELEDSVLFTTTLPPKTADKPLQRRRSTIADKRPPPLTAFSAPVAREERLVRIRAPSDEESESQMRTSHLVSSPNSVSETICFTTSASHPAPLISRVRSFNTAPLSAFELSMKDSMQTATKAEESTKMPPASKSILVPSTSISLASVMPEELSSVRSGIIGASGTLAFMETWRSKQRSEAEQSASVISMLPERACLLLTRVIRGYKVRCELAAAYREKNEERLLDAQLFKLMTTRWNATGLKPPQPPVVQTPLIPTPRVSFSTSSIGSAEPFAGSRSNRAKDGVAIPWERRQAAGTEAEACEQPQLASTPIGNVSSCLSAREMQSSAFPSTPPTWAAAGQQAGGALTPSTSTSIERTSLNNMDVSMPSSIGKGFNLGPHRASTPGGRHFFQKDIPTPLRRSNDSMPGMPAAAVTSPDGSVGSQPHLSSPAQDVSDESRDGDTPQDSQVSPSRKTAAAGATFTPLELSLGNMYSQSTRSMGSAYSIPFNMSTTSRSNCGPDLLTGSYEFTMGVSMGEQWMLNGVEVVNTDEDDYYDEHHSDSSSEEEEGDAAAPGVAGADDAGQAEANKAFGEEIQAIRATDDDTIVDAAVLLGKDAKALTQVDAVRLMQRVGRGYLCRVGESLSLLCKLFRPDIELIARVADGYLERKKLNVRHRVYTKVKRDLDYWELRNSNAIKIQRIIRSFVTRQKYLRLQRKLQTRLELRIATEQLEDSDDDI